MFKVYCYNKETEEREVIASGLSSEYDAADICKEATENNKDENLVFSYTQVF